MKNNMKEKWESICKNMQEFDKAYHKIASYYNLSDSSFWILYALYNSKKGYTQKELCEEWFLNKQTINSSIKYLQNKDYITLQYEENNRKFKRIYITNKGLELAEKTVKQVMNMENITFENVEEQEIDIVISFFEKQLLKFNEEINKKILEDDENE